MCGCGEMGTHSSITPDEPLVLLIDPTTILKNIKTCVYLWRPFTLQLDKEKRISIKQTFSSESLEITQLPFHSRPLIFHSIILKHFASFLITFPCALTLEIWLHGGHKPSKVLFSRDPYVITSVTTFLLCAGLSAGD